MVGYLPEIEYGQGHCPKTRLIGVEAIDFLRRHHPESHRGGRLPDDSIEGLTPLATERFRVVDALDDRIRREDDRCGDHRSGKRPHADLIDPGNGTQTAPPERSLEGQHLRGRRFSHGSSLFFNRCARDPGPE